MDRVILLVASILALLCMTSAHQDEPNARRGNRLRNRDREHDANHVKEHLDGVVEMNQDEPLSQDEQQFQYFKVHDYDNNNKLDGIELIAALTHFHQDKKDTSGPPKRLSDDELQSLVDTILTEDDHNNDGYIDYAEFMRSQQG